MDDPFYEGKQILFKDYSGQLDDEVFSSSAITQDHYLNITGGNDKSTFASSLGYYNEDGMIKGTGFQRFSGSFNASYKILPILNVKAVFLCLVYSSGTVDWFLRILLPYSFSAPYLESLE